MNTSEERILKNTFVSIKALSRDAKKRIKKLVLSDKISFLTNPNYNDILEALQSFLNHTSFRWVDLELSFSYRIKRFTDSPNIKVKIFLFGKRKLILKSIREVTGRIVAGDEWRKKEVGISSLSGLGIENFI